MVSVFDVAAYILEKKGNMTTMKLQKLVYYCQAWSLVWDEEPLFDEKIEAWENGPVVPALYESHRRRYKISQSDVTEGDSNLIKTHASQCETIDAVLEFYGDRSAQWLIELSHSERPWLETRGELKPFEKSSREIAHGVMADYYSGLLESENGKTQEETEASAGDSPF